jgi:hypothetical protein
LREHVRGQISDRSDLEEEEAFVDDDTGMAFEEERVPSRQRVVDPDLDRHRRSDRHVRRVGHEPVERDPHILSERDAWN